jgi:RND family efflux transporter MFP subunit
VENALAERRSADAALEAAEADLARARDAEADTSLLAPAAGIVAARTLEAGEIVQPGQPAYALAEDGPRTARFDIYEAALIGVDPDVAIDLEVLGASQRYSGHLREIAPSLDPRTGTIAVKLDIEGDAAALPLGATVVAYARARAVEAVILPASALALAGTKPAVWVISDVDSRLEQRPVEVHAFETGHVIITGGLAEGERVAILGPRAMRPGLLVETVAEHDQ